MTAERMSPRGLIEELHGWVEKTRDPKQYAIVLQKIEAELAIAAAVRRAVANSPALDVPAPTPVLKPCQILHDFDPVTWVCRHCGVRQPPL